MEKAVTKYTMEYYSDTKKEWDFDICNNMDVPRRYYVKWNKLPIQYL